MTYDEYLGQWDFSHRLTKFNFTSLYPRLVKGKPEKEYKEQIENIKAIAKKL